MKDEVPQRNQGQTAEQGKGNGLPVQGGIRYGINLEIRKDEGKQPAARHFPPGDASRSGAHPQGERLRLELASVLSEYQGASVMVTHDRDEAYQLCDTLLLLSRGQVIAAGKTKDIFNDPGSVEAARLTGCKNISRIEKIDDHRVCALDWDNLELSTEKTVTEDVTSIGIRAHDFEPVKDPEGINHIPVGHAKISEMPFEWYVTLQNGLWWKIGKTIHTHSADGLIPEYMRVAPEAILLLKG